MSHRPFILCIGLVFGIACYPSSCLAAQSVPLEGAWKAPDGTTLRVVKGKQGKLRCVVHAPNHKNRTFREFVTGDTLFEVVPVSRNHYRGWIADLITTRDPFARRQMELRIKGDQFAVVADEWRDEIDNRGIKLLNSWSPRGYAFKNRRHWICERIKGALPPIDDQENIPDKPNPDPKPNPTPPAPQVRQVILPGADRPGRGIVEVSWPAASKTRKYKLKLTIDRAGKLFQAYMALEADGKLGQVRQRLSQYLPLARKAASLDKILKGPQSKERKQARAERRKVQKSLQSIESGILRGIAGRDEREIVRGILQNGSVTPTLVIRLAGKERQVAVDLLKGSVSVPIDVPANEKASKFEIQGPMMRGTPVMMELSDLSQ